MTFYHRPAMLTQTMNRLMGWLASLGLTPSRMITLEVKGRRSGQPRSTVVNEVEYEGERYLVSPRGETEWVRNVRAAGGEACPRLLFHGDGQRAGFNDDRRRPRASGQLAGRVQQRG